MEISRAATRVKTCVPIESSDGEACCKIAGVSENVITVLYQALVDSIEYMLFRSLQRESPISSAVAR